MKARNRIFTLIGILFVPVAFSAVEYLSHRYTKGGKGTTMDSKPDFDPVAAGKAAGLQQMSISNDQTTGGHA